MAEIKMSSTDLERIRKRVNGVLEEWKQKTTRQVAIDHVILLNDVAYLAGLNEELAFKYHKIMSIMPSPDEMDLLVRNAVKDLEKSHGQEQIEFAAKHLKDLELLRKAIAKFKL